MFADDYRKIVSSSDKSTYERLAFEYLVEDPLIKNLHGSEKSKQVTGLDMETKIGPAIVSSLIYTFKYNSENINKSGKYQFYDYVPVVLCLGVINNYLFGINFNLLPNNIRAALLDSLVELDTEFYTKTAYSEIPTLSSVAKFLTNDDSVLALVKYISNKVGVDISKAYRKYNIKYIENLRLLEYDTWQYIPHLVFKDAVRGANLAEIQISMITDN